MLIIIIRIGLSDLSEQNYYYKNHKVAIEPGKVQLIIEPEYDEYLLNQRVWIKVVLRNLSNNDYYLKKSFFIYNLNLNITDPSGNKIHCGVELHGIKPRDSILIPPGDSVFSYENLDTYLGMKDNVPGVYKICANYQGIKSNEIEILMLEPTEIDKEVYDLTQKARMLAWTQEEISLLSDIIDHYPESKYIPEFYNRLLGIIIYEDKDINNEFLHYCNKYFSDYSNSYVSFNIVSHYDGYLQDRAGMNIEQVKQELKNLSNRHKNTVFEQLINFYIQKNYSDEMDY